MDASRAISVAEPAFFSWLRTGRDFDPSGIAVDEDSAMSLSAFYRGVNLIAGTLAGLPMRSYTTGPDDRPQRVTSIFDDPDSLGLGGSQTSFEWKETAFTHALLHGGAGALKIRNAAGGLARLQLIHPSQFTPRWPRPDEDAPSGGLYFEVNLADGEARTLDGEDFFYVPALSLDGRIGVSLLTYARLSLGTTQAGDEAAARTFTQGALISALASVDDDEGLEAEDFAKAREEINRHVLGRENAGRIPLINRRIKLSPFSMSLADAQFLQSRQFQIEEIARWLGIPPHLLMQTEKQTSWGTGVDEQNQGLSKFVLGQWAQRFEERASRLLPNPRWVEFDFAGLERPNFATNVGLVLQQMAAGLISAAYGRKLLNIPEGAAPAAPASGGTDAPAE